MVDRVYTIWGDRVDRPITSSRGYRPWVLIVVRILRFRGHVALRPSGIHSIVYAPPVAIDPYPLGGRVGMLIRERQEGDTLWPAGIRTYNDSPSLYREEPNTIVPFLAPTIGIPINKARPPFVL